jgi:hypothetical protein
MRHHVYLVSELLLLASISVEGAPQKISKISVQANGQLTVSHNDLHHNATRIMRREGIVGTIQNQVDSDTLMQESSAGPPRCGWTTFAPDDPCPEECPLLAEESWNPCHFQCVTMDQCGNLDPKATIPDFKQKRCRPCVIAGCEKCAAGAEDKCHKCNAGYILNQEGQCYSAGYYIWNSAAMFGAAVITLLFLYLVELACRRTNNHKGLKHGMAYRQRIRMHMPADTDPLVGIADPGDTAGLLYPLTTNLTTTPVGGVATALHFSFQAYVIIWAAFHTAMWAYWVSLYGMDLLKLGILPASLPQELCAIVKWGAKRQEELGGAKLMYIISSYFFQFGSCIVLAVMQQNRFIKLDDEATLKDYACYVRGMPRKTGEEDAEGIFKEFLEKETGQQLIGVSVAWDMMKRTDYEEIEAALELEAATLEKEHTLAKYGGPAPEDPDHIDLPSGGLTKAFYHIDKLWPFGDFSGKAEEEEAPVDAERMSELLKRLKTSDVCFAVFKTEEERDAAVTLSKSKRGFIFEKNVVRLEVKACEPTTVLWHGLSLGSRTRQRNTKMFFGCFYILGCLAVWTIVFYLPYAYFVTSFTYANGSAPSAVANMVFTILVVAGNQAMYFAADTVANWCDFGFEDERMFWYNLYFLSACVLNVVADLFVTGKTSYEAMVGLEVHTADGRLLSSLTKVQDILESYPMQKTMGRMLFAYNFPGTFLLPFIIESIATVLFPYFMGSRLLRSHPEVQGRKAELAMEHFQPMDLARYSDILLNMSLAVMTLYLPGGYVLPTFMSMALSQVFIYVFDHWRALRFVPEFSYSRNLVDRFASSWMALPCALTASCAVFKGYPFYWPDLHGASLFCVMLWAFMAHWALHLFIIGKIYKLKGKHKRAEKTYAEVAEHHAETWFSTNPVHCLRSKYIKGHQPAQVFHMKGKKHLQRRNPDIGCHFEDEDAQKPPPKEGAD